MGLDLLFVAAGPFLVVIVFRKIDIELVFSSHRVGVVGVGGGSGLWLRWRKYEYII